MDRDWAMTARLVLFLCALALIPAATAHGTPAHHGPHVADIHYPDAPARGEPVPVQVRLTEAANVTDVRLIYCRVQHYACGPALRMESNGGTEYAATVPWTSRFFKDVTKVGLRVELEQADGNVTHSPLDHYPSRPADLPPEGDTYYYYSLAAESPAPPALLVVAAAFLAFARWTRR